MTRDPLNDPQNNDAFKAPNGDTFLIIARTGSMVRYERTWRTARRVFAVPLSAWRNAAREWRLEYLGGKE